MLEENTLSILLASFFHTHGYVRICGLGSFRKIKASEGITRTGLEEPAKGSIEFHYNPEETVDSDLIGFITSRTRKMEALAVSDLETLATQAREMINIGQSFTFKGIAILIPDLRGQFEVIADKIPSHLQSRKSPAPEIFRHAESPPPFKEGKVHAPENSQSVGGVVVAGVTLAIVAGLIYFLFLHQASPPQADGIGPALEATTDTAPQVSVRQTPLHTLLHYEVVFEEATRTRALSRYRQLTGWGHDIILKTPDSLHYTLAVPFTTPASDTAAAKDSIRILYGRPVYLRMVSGLANR